MDSALMGLLGPYLSALQGEPTDMGFGVGMAGGGDSLGGLAGLLQLAQGQQGGGGGGGTGGGGSYDPNASHWEQVAENMARNQYGWGPHQFNAIDTIANAESGWNPHAVNPSSGAAGIPQALPSAHPGLVDQQWMNDPRAQIQWMLNYIKQRYGNPQHALSVRSSQGWY